MRDRQADQNFWVYVAQERPVFKKQFILLSAICPLSRYAQLSFTLHCVLTVHYHNKMNAMRKQFSHLHQSTRKQTLPCKQFILHRSKFPTFFFCIKKNSSCTGTKKAFKSCWAHFNLENIAWKNTFRNLSTDGELSTASLHLTQKIIHNVRYCGKQTTH